MPLPFYRVLPLLVHVKLHPTLHAVETRFLAVKMPKQRVLTS